MQGFSLIPYSGGFLASKIPFGGGESSAFWSPNSFGGMWGGKKESPAMIKYNAGKTLNIFF